MTLLPPGSVSFSDCSTRRMKSLSSASDRRSYSGSVAASSVGVAAVQNVTRRMSLVRAERMSHIVASRGSPRQLRARSFRRTATSALPRRPRRLILSGHRSAAAAGEARTSPAARASDIFSANLRSLLRLLFDRADVRGGQAGGEPVEAGYAVGDQDEITSSWDAANLSGVHA